MMNKSNKSKGSQFEDAICEALGTEGFWVHKLAQTEIGQPADIIAVKDGRAYLFDCKRCITDRFELSRVEPNQILAMNYWASKGNGEAYFVIGYDEPNSTFIVPLSYILGIERGSLTLKELRESEIDFSFNTWRWEH